MAVLALSNGKRYDVSEKAKEIDVMLEQETGFLRLELVMTDGQIVEYEKIRVMVKHILYWY